MTDSSTKKSCWYVQIHRSNLFWQKHNEIRRGMFVSLRVMDRDLAMSSVHVSHRQTFSEWYIHKVQMIGSKCLILERICFVQLYEKKKSLFWCVVEKNARWKCMKGRQTFLNGEKSICNRHSFFQYKWNIRLIGKMSLSLYFFVFHKVSEQNSEFRFDHIPFISIKAIRRTSPFCLKFKRQFG